jgi:hypothetical protein
MRLLRGLQTAIRRILSDWPVVAAALATVILSSTLLAAGPIYGESITISAFARAMEDAPHEESAVSISAGPMVEDYDAVDRLVHETADRAMGAADGRIVAIARASVLRIANPSADGALAETWYVEGVEDLATLVDGRWPADNATEVALPEVAASAIGLGVGDTLQLVPRSGPDASYDLEVVGVYRFDDPGEAAWFGDPLVADGSIVSGGDSIYGPFVTGRTTLLTALGASQVRAIWRVLPDFLTLQVDDIGRFGTALSRLHETLNAAKGSSPDIAEPGRINFSSLTRISDRLGVIDRSLTVTSSTILAVTLQLALLALYALVLTSRLVVDTRTAETALARSRGASPTQVAVPAFFEGLLLGIPAVLLGPRIASRLIALLAGFGPIAEIGLTIEPETSRSSYLLAAAAAAVAVLTLLWPAFRAARAFPDQQKKTRRTSGRSGAQRLGIDLVLVAMLAIAIWQLGELGPRVSSTVRGRFGVDPLLVVAPALGLAAGVILALRVIPRLARLAERLVSGRMPMVPALAMWQVARRPDRYSRSALLLMTAVALGVFASSFAASWATSQSDQAHHRVGADVKLVARTTPDAPTDLHMRDLLGATPGVRSAIPVIQTRGPVTRGIQGRLFLTDAAGLAAVVRPRSDVAGDLHELARLMAEQRITLPVVDLAGEPEVIRTTWEAREIDPETGLPVEDVCPDEATLGCFYGRIDVVVQDGNGMLIRLPAGTIRAGQGPTTLETPLLAEDGSRPAYPVSVAAFEFTTISGRFQDGLFTDDMSGLLTLVSAEAADASGSASPVHLDPSGVDVSAVAPPQTDVFRPPAARVEPGGGLTVEIDTGLVYRRFSGQATEIVVGIQPGSARLRDVFPVIATEAALQSGAWEVGMRVNLRALDLPNASAELIGTIPGLPGVDAAPPLVVIVDLPSYQALSYEPGAPIQRAEEYWVAADDPEAAADAIARPPIRGGGVVDRESVTREMMSDPIALGTVGAFAIGFVSSAVFAVIGFTISTLVSARERQVEFSLLHALGLKRGQMGRWLLLEQAVLVVVALVLGLGIGVGISEFLLPLVTLNQDGTKAVPELVVVHDWASIWTLQSALLVSLGVVLGILVSMVARRGVASALRSGDEP